MYKVLLIDDKEVFRRKIKRLPYFQENAEKFMICHEAQNGLEALDIIRNSDIDVVLTDIRMPIIDGIELLKTISNEKLCKCTVLLSEYADFSYAKAGILNGAFDYIVKPIDNEKMQASFDRVYDYLTAVNKNVNLMTKKIEALADCIFSGNRSDVTECTDQIADNVKNETKMPNDQILMLKDMLERVGQVLLKKYPDVSRFVPVTDICSMKLAPEEENRRFEIFKRQALLLKNRVNRIFIRPKNHLVKKVCDYIIQNVENEISLKAISKEFFVDKKYFGMLFKKEVGTGFVEYTTLVKMERAKMLLSNPEIKIYEVATMLGYSDKDYFSKLFKKYTSEPPSSFKEGKY